MNQEHLDTIKSEMFGDFLQGLIRLSIVPLSLNIFQTVALLMIFQRFYKVLVYKISSN